MLRLPLAGCAAVLAVGLAACGGDSDGGPGATTPLGPTDQARARAIVLRASDLPAGWTANPPSTTDGGEGEAFRQCLGLLPKVSPSADSPNFSTTASMTVGSSVTVASTERAIDRDFAAFVDDKALPCLEQRFDAQARRQVGASFGSGRAARFEFPALGDATSAVRISSVATVGDQQVPFTLDVVTVKLGRVGITMTFANAPEPFPADLATELTGKVLARAA